METVGIVGLGLLGHAVASRLRAKGHDVVGYDILPEKVQGLIALGGRSASSVTEVARVSDAVCSILPSEAAVEEAILGPSGIVAAGRPDQTIIQMSTISPTLTERLAREVLIRGLAFLDAPVSGTSAMVARGEGVILIGGERALFDRWRRVLEAILPRVVYVGEAGQAMVAKLAANLLVGVNTLAAAEALLMAEKAGLDLNVVLEILRSGAATSRMLEVRGPMILQRQFPPQMKLDIFLKDLSLIMDAGERLGASLPLTRVAQQLYAAAKAAGHGEEDLASVVTALEHPGEREIKRKQSSRVSEQLFEERQIRGLQHHRMQYRSETRDGMRIDWNVPITMDDGLVLSADLFRPIAEGEYPVVLSYGPYAKGLAFQDGYPNQWQRMTAQHPEVAAGSTNKYQSWEIIDPEKWVADSYVCVRVDSRGCGCSPGIIDHFSPRETRDLYNCIEWAGVQPWSNGKVGLNGISYYAINQWHVASLQPPHLAAMCIWEGAADWYRDMTHHGGILCTFWANWYDMQVKTVQHGLGKRGPLSRVTGGLVCGPETLSDEELAGNRCDLDKEILAHPLDDDYHKARSPVWSRVTAPFLSAGNWGGQGLHLRGNVEGFVRAASPQKWLELHGLEHWTHFYTDYGRLLQKRFFDCFLKGIDSGWHKEPRVRLQVRRIDGFVERMENEWPIARTQWTKLYLNPAGRGLNWAPAGASGRVEYDAMSDGVTFLSPPLEQETEITGPSAVKLFISSSTADADIFVVLRVFSSSGKEVVFQGAIDPHTPVGQGWLRASHRKLDPELSRPYRPYHTHDEKQPLSPGQVVELEIEIWPTSIVVPAGYKIGLTVRGRDYEYPGASGARLSNFKNELRGCGPFLHDDPCDRPPEIFGGKTTLHIRPDRPSHLLLPIIPPRHGMP